MPDLSTISLRQRLYLVALLCTILCLIPSAQLAHSMLGQLATAARARAALPANRDWQSLLQAVNAHRLARTSLLQANIGTESDRQQASARVDQAFVAVASTLQQQGALQERQEAAAGLRRDFQALNQALAKHSLDAAALVQQQQVLQQ